MKTLTFTGKTTTKNDVAKIESPEQGQMAQRVLEAFGENADLQIIFRKIGKAKTNPQLGYFHAVVLPDLLAGMLDLGNDEVHIELTDFEGKLSGLSKKYRLTLESLREWLKREFLDSQPVADPDTGEVTGFKPPSVGRLNREELAAFIDRCIRFGAEALGIQVRPCTNELSWLSLQEKEPPLANA